MAAAADSKSAVREYVRVRVPPLAPMTSQMLNDWRGVRVVDGATLERLCGGNSTGGSNPPLSATVIKYDVIHFNNGLHSLMTSTEAYAKSLKRVGI